MKVFFLENLFGNPTFFIEFRYSKKIIRNFAKWKQIDRKKLGA